MSDDTVLRVTDLHVSFGSELGEVEALKGISFSAGRSRTTAIVGESGSGKSVTAYSIMRLIQKPGRITSGSIIFEPEQGPAFDILKIPETSPDLYDLRGGSIAMIFQEPMTALSPVHTIGNQVMEAILTHQQVTEAQAFKTASQMLGHVGISDPDTRMHQYPFEFSGGMRQRVVIAMALVCQPEILICDEPTTALDVTVQAEILSLIRALKAEMKTSVLFITHDLGVVAQIADEVIVMHHGRILETGSVREVLRTPLHPYTQALLAAVPGTNQTERLKSVGERLNLEDMEIHPLVTVAPGRQVALPPERIAGITL